tara:strand:+ start:882 stop:1196 length:315 start_codon:yes stop_codon:yes gene_type:complete
MMMHSNQMPKTVTKWLEKNKEKIWAIDIEDTDPNENGDYSIWVYLKGYKRDECHTIHRSTAKAFLEDAKCIEKCTDDCENCTKDTKFQESSQYYFNEEGKLTKR